MIEFHDVHKSFGSLDVLKGINLKIEKSQVVTLIGPSGSGKSTILRCMNLLERPTSGQVLIEGQDITAPKTDIQKIRKDIGMVFQHFNLFPHMTVMENMVFAREVSDRICFIDNGQIVEDSNPAEFFSNPKSERAQNFLEKVL